MIYQSKEHLNLGIEIFYSRLQHCALVWQQCGDKDGIFMDRIYNFYVFQSNLLGNLQVKSFRVGLIFAFGNQHRRT